MRKSSLLRMGGARCAQAQLMVSEGATSVGLRKQSILRYLTTVFPAKWRPAGIGTSAEIPHWWRMGSVFPDLWEVAALQNVSYFLRLPTQLTKLITLISYPDLTLSLLIHSKNRRNEVECMLCHNTISLVCFCLQFARYKKDICEVARALNCPEEDRWKEKGWKDDIEY